MTYVYQYSLFRAKKHINKKKIKKNAISKKDKPLSNKKKTKKNDTKKIGKGIRRGHLYMRSVFPQVLYITSKA